MEYALMPAPSTYSSKQTKNWIDHILIRISNSVRKMGTRILSFPTRLNTEKISVLYLKITRIKPCLKRKM